MAGEYVGMPAGNATYGKKHLLYCEMELLKTVQRYQKYKKLRKEELALKKLLKKAITQLHDEVRKFDDILPHLKMQKFEPVSISKSDKKRNDLANEIEEIKRKIAMLQ